MQKAGKYSDKERNIKPITSIQKLVSKEMRELIGDIKYSKKDYKRGALKEGYSYEEAKIIERKISFLYGEEFRLMIRVFIEAGVRLEELQHIKFEDIKEDPGSYTGFAIYLWHENQCKNNRKRRVLIFEAAGAAIKFVLVLKTQQLRNCMIQTLVNKSAVVLYTVVSTIC